MISFENCDVTINGTGIMADSASLSSQSQSSPLYVAGYMHPVGYTPIGPFQNILQVTYFFESRNAPTYGIANYLKYLATGSQSDGSVTIALAGITGTYYLDTFRIEGRPNTPIKATASFVSFNALSGALTGSSNSVSYNTASGSGLAHFYTAALSYRRPFNNSFVNQTYTTKNIVGFNYNLKVNWIPAYGLGNKYPLDVKLNTMEEVAEITHEDFVLIAVSGSNPEGALSLPDLSRSFPTTFPTPEFVICLAPFSELPITDRLFDYPFISVSKGIAKASVLTQQAGTVTRTLTTIQRNY